METETASAAAAAAAAAARTKQSVSVQFALQTVAAAAAVVVLPPVADKQTAADTPLHPEGEGQLPSAAEAARFVHLVQS